MSNSTGGLICGGMVIQCASYATLMLCPSLMGWCCVAGVVGYGLSMYGLLRPE